MMLLQDFYFAFYKGLTLTKAVYRRFPIGAIKCVPGGRRQVAFCASCSTGYVYIRESSCNPNFMALGPDRPRCNSPATCVIAQQYFFAIFVLLTLSNPIFLLTAYSPALICFGRERGWWITCNYSTVLKEKNIEKQKEYNLRYLLAKVRTT
jgi:hypothetical protein